MSCADVIAVSMSANFACVSWKEATGRPNIFRSFV